MSRSIRQSLMAFLLALWAAPTLLWSSDAIGWRGNGTGLYADAHPPTEWDSGSGKNILWRTKVGKGRSTPVISSGRVYITAEPEALLCLDEASGTLLWTRDNNYGSLQLDDKAPKQRPPTSPDCGYSSPTPVVFDGHIYCVFGSGIVVCYDLKGDRQWTRLIDARPTTEYGRSVSPLLAGGRLLVSFGGVTALDPGTGAILWDAPKAKASYGTPAVMKLGDVELAITPNGDCIRLSDGHILASKLASMKYTSPLVVDDVVYFAEAPTAGFKLALKADGKLESHKLWDGPDEMEGEFFASPICHDGILYTASNQGILYALDARTGQLRWQRDLDIRSAAQGKSTEPANIYPSLTLAGNNIYVGNDAGEMLILKPGGRYQQISRAAIGNGSGASPAPNGNTLLLRGGGVLYRIGDGKH